MKLPNFLVIGAMKCGTTSLCELLGAHPDVFMCDPKEPCFFSHHFDRGIGWYEAHFEDARGHKAIGEGSPEYTKAVLYPEARDRIASVLPEAKLIYIVRNPRDQILSNWIQCISGNHETLPFEEAVREHPSYLDTCNYIMQIDRYREFYDDSRILVLFFEDFKVEPDSILRKCFEFLGVETAFAVPDSRRQRNASSEKRRDRVLTGIMKRLPGFRGLLSCVPSGLVTAVRPLVKRRIVRPDWRPETWHWVREQMRENTQMFLIRYGKAPSFWEL